MSPRRAPDSEAPVISTPGDRRDENGRKWAWDTIGKAVAVVLATIMLGLWARVGLIYGLPPRMDKAEEAIKGLQAAVASPRPMSSPEIDALAAAIVQALPPARKGKP